ncbi:hypothetical protein SPHINGOAX6_20198 [Sphingomonas sp. AX6]|nr:hypothetical protein SPHINGOAX6_20198 [Sphingomonas sp. AX6]
MVADRNPLPACAIPAFAGSRLGRPATTLLPARYSFATPLRSAMSARSGPFYGNFE